MRHIVYTCITNLKDNPYLLEGRAFTDIDAEYVLFTDKETYVSGWTTKPLYYKASNPILTARWHKINSHILFAKDASTIWIDGNQLPNGSATPILQSAPFGVFRHPYRSCIYDEAVKCKELGKDRSEVIERQMNRYRHEGYPSHNGLAETSCIYRFHNQLIKLINEKWWNQIINGSYRDQLSLNYVLWKVGTTYKIIPGSRSSSSFLLYHEH